MRFVSDVRVVFAGADLLLLLAAFPARGAETGGAGLRFAALFLGRVLAVFLRDGFRLAVFLPRRAVARGAALRLAGLFFRPAIAFLLVAFFFFFFLVMVGLYIGQRRVWDRHCASPERSRGRIMKLILFGAAGWSGRAADVRIHGLMTTRVLGRAVVLGLFLVVFPLSASEPLKFTVVGIDCEDCSPPILKALRGVPGVRNATLDWKAGTATVEVADGFDRERVRKALQEIGYEAVFDGEQRQDLRPLPDDERRKLDMASASEGEKIEVAKTLVPGKVTVLDYWAEWCSPCHLLDIRLQHLVKADPKLAVRRINVGKWDNAAARQVTSEFRAEALPYVRVYDARGKFVGAATGGAWDKVLKLVEKARARGAA